MAASLQAQLSFLHQQQHQQQYSQQQLSFHFWHCQLTAASPKHSWDPENWAASGQQSTQQRPGRHGNADAGEGEKSNGEGEGEKAKAASNGEGQKSEIVASAKTAANGEEANGEANNGEEATGDADFMQHVLKVNACILGPKASGVHVVAVRTRCYNESEAAACPIVCLDSASQRTLTLAYEFVLDSQNVVAFELVEGDGPVWLTGLHQVRVHDAAAAAEGEGEEEDESEGEVNEDEEDAEASMESIEEEDEEEEEEEEEEAEPPQAKRAARAPPPAKTANGEKQQQQRPVASPRRRGRPAAAKK